MSTTTTEAATSSPQNQPTENKQATTELRAPAVESPNIPQNPPENKIEPSSLDPNILTEKPLNETAQIELQPSNENLKTVSEQPLNEKAQVELQTPEKLETQAEQPLNEKAQVELQTPEKLETQAEQPLNEKAQVELQTPEKLETQAEQLLNEKAQVELQTPEKLGTQAEQPSNEKSLVELQTPSENLGTLSNKPLNENVQVEPQLPSEKIEATGNEETSKQNQKALEFLASAEGTEDDVEEKELDLKALSKQIINILNEDRSDTDLSKEQLLEKSEDLQNFISKLVQALAEKTELCVRLDRQNAALINQAKTLKNVIAITKDLLGIRNMEVEHLHADLKIMEESISAERTRHDTLLKKLAEAMNLNEQLKNEYHNQSGLFQSLREKYHEKIVLLTKENQRLKNLAEESKEGNSGEGENKEEECLTQETGDVSSSAEVVEK